MFTPKMKIKVEDFETDQIKFHRRNFNYYYHAIYNESKEQTQEKCRLKKRGFEKTLKKRSMLVWRVISIIKEEVNWSERKLSLELTPKTEDERKDCQKHFEKLVNEGKIILKEVKENSQLNKVKIKAKKSYKRKNHFDKSKEMNKELEEKSLIHEAKEIETDEGEDELESS